MRIFVTGATGFIGSVVVQDLLRAGHHVLGLTRSDTGARKLLAAGAEVHRGDLEHLKSLQSGAEAADGVIHTAFNHDFSHFVANCAADGHAIEAMGSVLLGSNRPLIITSGVGMGAAAPGQPATEATFNPQNPNPRRASEIAGNALAERGVNVSVVRLPQVHNTIKQGLITPLIDLARETRISAYVDAGSNRWSAVHLTDAAPVYRMALEKRKPGARYHAVAEAGVPLRTIAEAIARGLNIPSKSLTRDEAKTHFGWLALFSEHDMTASSAVTQSVLDWHPTGPGLISDLEQMNYAKS